MIFSQGFNSKQAHNFKSHQLTDSFKQLWEASEVQTPVVKLCDCVS